MRRLGHHRHTHRAGSGQGHTAAQDHSEPEEVIYDRWRAELAEHGIGERTYVERIGRAGGQTLTEDQTAALLEELAGLEGLTAQASTFARRDVVDQLARRLPVGPPPR